MALIRLVVLVLAVEALFYALISVYVRSLRREALEEAWARRHPDRPGDGPERRRFIRRSMTGFRRSLKARLVGLVFVLPTLAIVVIAWIVNFD
ncbi:hypothetical protein [Paracoccus luteus]|uniref:hypothetical protein n=1 Tax=Paracoccus luteus TaxID=2508543 RepID=UPI00106FBF01|nr:hypothetical protein [Paracoccus luteus]